MALLLAQRERSLFTALDVPRCNLAEEPSGIVAALVFIGVRVAVVRGLGRRECSARQVNGSEVAAGLRVGQVEVKTA